MDAIATRLVTHPDLVLPSSVSTKERHEAPVEDATVLAYLRKLLSSSPALFLERYGRLLAPLELSAFQPLRSGDYAVDHWVTRLEAVHQASAQPRRLPTSVKNRRLAYMRRLEDEGDFFSEESMRERAPLLFHELLGRYMGEPSPPSSQAAHAQPQLGAAGGGGDGGSATAAGPPPDGSHQDAALQQAGSGTVGAAGSTGGDVSGGMLSRHLLQHLDAAEWRMRLEQEQQQEEGQLSEQEEDEEGEEEDDDEVEEEDEGEGDERARGRGGRGIGQAVDGAAGPSGSDGYHHHDDVACGRQPRRCGASVESLSAGRLGEQRLMLLAEMRVRFLTGQDAAHGVDYGLIDGDLGLDDDLLEQQRQDAEDAYFDED